VASGKYKTCCLLSCNFIPGHEILAVAATDGHVGFFSIPTLAKNTVHDDWSFHLRFPIHQSSVKCMQIIPISSMWTLYVILMVDSVIYLLTGGDDNAIVLTEVSFDTEVRCTKVAFVTDAHTSTITGVLSLGRLQFLSISIDQRIRIWGLNGSNLVCLCQAYTFVSDVCGIVEIPVHGRKRRFVIFGTGMELIAWEE